MIFNMGRELLPRKPVERLFPVVKPHCHFVQDDYECATCLATMQAHLMWTPTECADCHAKKGTPQHVTPLEADPTSAGWVKSTNMCDGKTWFKGDFEMRCNNPADWRAWKSKNTGFSHALGLSDSGLKSNSCIGDPFSHWREIDALLFPKAREFRVGDVVELLEFSDTHCERIHAVGGIRTIRNFRDWSFIKTGPEKCAEVGCTDDQCRPNWYWPVRALRLIRAVDA